jgi:transcriptional antiterminator
MKEISEDFIVIKAFNNNIVLTQSNGTEKLLFAKGIGFSKKMNDIIPMGTKVDKIFVIEDKKNIRSFEEILNNNDDEFLALCEEVIYSIAKDLNEDLSENIHIGLISHLSFALKRLKHKEQIENPFLVEIETLYSLEFKLAKKAARKVKKETGIEIPDGEIGFIALHIHSARNNGKLSNTIKYSFLCNSIVEYVEDNLNIEIDKKSLDYARFLTHIRFAIERIMTNKQNKNDFIDIIKESYAKSYEISIAIAKMIENELDIKVDDDEMAYLAMHIERFRVSLQS